MGDYKPKDNRNTSLNLMGRRLGLHPYHVPHKANVKTEEEREKVEIWINDKIKEPQEKIDLHLDGVDSQKRFLDANGGTFQQERMIFDKRRTLDRAVLYSYQGAVIKGIKSERSIRALINPNKNKVDYDDKVLSVQYEYGLTVGDVFEWEGTNTYWLIYLQDLTELAYFRGDIRRCSYEINWEDEDGNKHSTYAAVRGPVETKINYIQKNGISVDEPNHSLHILMPRNKETLEYFRRYSKFYLRGEDEGSPQICWRVEATDWISTPGILEITAVEYYINKDKDDPEEGVAGGLIAKPINPNTETVEAAIVGETFIKPKMTYSYHYEGPKLPSNTQWRMDKKYPVEVIVDDSDRTKLTLKWTSNYSGQILLSYGEYSKTIVIESLF